MGAGFAGLGAAIKLQEDGESDFVVLEKGSDVGGTWRDNTYPGATCDVPSQLYSYSFREFDWPNSYSPQPEIQAYIKQVADESGTLDRFVFDTLVEDAAWDDETQRWRCGPRPAAGHPCGQLRSSSSVPAASPRPSSPRSTASTPSRASSSTPRGGTTTST